VMQRRRQTQAHLENNRSEFSGIEPAPPVVALTVLEDR
jgi:hypothetical protein